jgi:hypothetical protein
MSRSSTCSKSGYERKESPFTRSRPAEHSTVRADEDFRILLGYAALSKMEVLMSVKAFTRFAEANGSASFTKGDARSHPDP